MFLSQTDTAGIVSSIERLKLNQDETLGIFLGEKNAPDLQDLVNQLNELDISFFGGMFPGLINGNDSFTEGVLLTPIKCFGPPAIVPNLNDGSQQIPEFFREIASEQRSKMALMVLIDGLFPHIGTFLANIYHQIGPEVKYFGGGAGSLDLVSKPCLFNPQGVFQDAGLLLAVPMENNFGVSHGWEVLQDGLIASRTEGNFLQELNWKDAFSIYQHIVEKDSGLKLSKENFFDVAKSYPFGMLRENDEHIIRDPIAVGENGELICVAEVPENVTLAIMKGTTSSLVTAAKRAAKKCLSEYSESQNNLNSDSGLWVIDCISRSIFFGEDFSSELNAVSEIGREKGIQKPIEGVLSLGEISSQGNGTVEFLNKTIVVGVLNG